MHDTYRRTADGKGTSAAVLRAIEALQRHGVAYNILALVTQANVHRAAEVFDYFVRQGFQHLQFIPCIEKDPHTGQRAPYAITAEQYGTFLCELFDAWYAYGPDRVSERLFDALLSYYAYGITSACFLSPLCNSYLVVERDGSVFPCDFFVRPEWRLGNVMEQSLVQIARSERAREFAHRKAEVAPECRRCRFIELCWGGCMKDRMFPHGDMRAPSYFCPAYMRFFAYSEERLRSLARRLPQA